MKKVKKTVVPDNPRLDNQSQTKPLSGLKKLIQNIGKQESSDSEDRKDFVQDIIGINEIYDGFFFMKSGQVIGIVEVIPLNYHQRTNTEKHIIINYFIKFLRIANDTMHYKVRTEKADVNQIITNILKSNVNEKDPLEIFVDDDKIILKKYEPCDIFDGSMDDLVEYCGKKVSISSIMELARIAGLNVTK